MKEAEDEVNSGGCLGVHRDIYQRYSLRFQTKSGTGYIGDVLGLEYARVYMQRGQT